MSWEPINPKSSGNNELVGDEPFDFLADALVQVVECYRRDLNRKPSALELVKTFERVLAPRFSEAVLEGETSELVSLSFKTKKVPKKQKFQEGDVIKTKAANGQFIYGRIFKIEKGLGPAIGVYDSLGFELKSLDELRKLRLIVKVSLIHRDLLERREWIVIGNLPINAADFGLPEGPAIISGVNEQLKAVNHYYGLSVLPGYKAYDIEKWLNIP